MRKNNIFVINQTDAVKPSPNISDTRNKEELSAYITEWHIANNTIENRSVKTEKSSNNLEDQKNQYPLFF